MQVKMKYKKSTKNTHVYEPVVEETVKDVFLPPISVLYIMKSALKGTPQELTVTVTYDE